MVTYVWQGGTFTSKSAWDKVPGEKELAELGSRLNYFFSIPTSSFGATELNISMYAFLYIQGADKEKKYTRYTIKKGTYAYPTKINNALVVTPDNKDDEGLIVSSIALGNVTNDMFVIGFTDSLETFKVNGNSDKAIGDVKKEFNAILTDISTSLEKVSTSFAKAGLPYFSLKNLQLTDTEISFESYSFLYIKKIDGTDYQRYTIKPGTYSLPTEINKAIAVSLDNKDVDDNLIPVVTDVQIIGIDSKYYLIGLTTSNNKFVLADSASLHSIVKAVQSTATNAQSTATNAQSTATNALELAKSYSSFFSKEELIIDSSVLKKNINYRLNDDGTIIGADGDWNVVSDFIEIKGRIENVKFCFNTSQNYAGLAFYSENNEQSFISALKDYTEELQHKWVKYNGSIVIPANAKYIRIAGNTFLYAESPNIEMYEIIFKEENVYADAPSSGYEYFSYDVDTAKEDIEDSEQSTSIVFPSVISKDNGFIRLPESYSKNGKPTRLVIVNHGAGGKVTENSSENGNSTFVLLLQKKGYAILCINGVPEAMRNTKYMNGAENGAAAHMGGWVYMRSALAAYNYVTEKYNIAKDGCFIIGRSMGGVTSLNLAMSGVIPVKALALDAPVIDSLRDAYFSGNWSGGTLGGKTPAIFAWIFQWDYCNFDDDTYTIPTGQYDIYGQSYNVETEEAKLLASLYQNNQDMAILWHLNENKMYGYNAYKTGDFLINNMDDSHVYNLTTDNDDDYYGKKMPCPCKIWFGSGDTVNQMSIAERFIKKVRNGGSIAMLRTCPTNRHTVWNETETMPGGVDISVIEDGITCSPYGIELWNWIKRWDG